MDIHGISEPLRRLLMRTDLGMVHQNPRDGLRMSVSAGANIGERLMAVGSRHSLPEAVARVSANPAEMVHLHDRGQILPGRRADLVRVKEHAGLPMVRTVWKQGERVI